MKSEVLVFGLGLTGRSVVEFLKSQGISFVAVDDKVKEPGVISSAEALQIDGIHRLILSPGIPQSHPLVQKHLKQGAEVIGDVELAFREFKGKKRRPKIIGITGSNGKTTTTLLTTHMLKSAGFHAVAVGNVEEPILKHIETPVDYLVLELSSFQLETIHTPLLDAAIVLNITPNHLDRHTSMEEYAGVKLHILDLALNRENCFVYDQISSTNGIRFGRATNLEGRKVKGFGEIPQAIRKAESHDVLNFLAAFHLASTAKVTFKQAVDSYATFVKPPHRIEYVDAISGVQFWDDSKGTTVEATIRAVDTVPDPIILIAGGVHKGEPYTQWQTLKDRVHHIITLGKAAELIESDLKGMIPCTRVSSLKEAVLVAFKQAVPGFSVLLSPGCSSYDMFRDYKDRGIQFKAAVKELKDGAI